MLLFFILLLSSCSYFTVYALIVTLFPPGFWGFICLGFFLFCFCVYFSEKSREFFTVYVPVAQWQVHHPRYAVQGNFKGENQGSFFLFFLLVASSLAQVKKQTLQADEDWNPALPLIIGVTWVKLLNLNKPFFSESLKWRCSIQLEKV